jgi:hypothetical protein
MGTGRGRFWPYLPPPRNPERSENPTYNSLKICCIRAGWVGVGRIVRVGQGGAGFLERERTDRLETTRIFNRTFQQNRESKKHILGFLTNQKEKKEKTLTGTYAFPLMTAAPLLGVRGEQS